MRPEHWLYTIPLRLRSLFRRGAVERELDEELREHFERQVEANIALGMNQNEARRAARLALGGLEQQKEECRDARRVTLVESLLRDILQALTTLRRNPGFTAIVVLTLGLGIGATTSIYTVVKSVLLSPLPYRDSNELVLLTHGSAGRGTVATANFLDWRGQTRSFDRVGAAESWSPSFTGTDRPEELRGLLISPDILPMMGIEPQLGRVFLQEEELEGRHRVVVLSFPFWRERFAADPGVLQRTLTLNGEAHTIVGVMPEGFDFAPFWATNTQLWAPLKLDGRRDDRNGASLRVFGRLRAGVDLAQARTDLAAVAARLERAYPGTNQNVTVVPLLDVVVGDVHDTLLILLVAVCLVLLIACANVAHLELMRAAAREREFALRAALGASRGRLLQQSFVESGMLAVVGAVLGVVLAAGGVHLLRSLAPPELPRLDAIRMDLAVLGFAGLAAMVSALVFGAAPALATSRADVRGRMEGGKGTGDSRRRSRFRGALVGSEFAIALLLLVGAGLVLKSFARLRIVDPGFDPRNLLSLQVSLRGTGHADRERRAGFFRELTATIRDLPGVAAVGAINHLPLDGDTWRFPFAIEGQRLPEPGRRNSALFRVIQPGYFDAMRVPLVAGRDLSDEDEVNAAHVVIVNETMAARHWNGDSPLGRRLTVDDPSSGPEWFTVVGVAKDSRQGDWAEATAEEMYFPYLSTGETHLDGGPAGRLVSFLNPVYLTLVVRTTVEPSSLAKPIEAAVHRMDRAAPVSSILTMEQAIASEFVAPKFYLLLLGAFAGVAVVLAAVGVYGVISYSVARRTREIGVRLALGARRDEVFRLVVRQGMTLALAGGMIGLLGAFFATRFLGSLLYGVQPTDPVVFAAGGLGLALVALVACALPARRASRVNPTQALRSE